MVLGFSGLLFEIISFYLYSFRSRRLYKYLGMLFQNLGILFFIVGFIYAVINIAKDDTIRSLALSFLVVIFGVITPLIIFRLFKYSNKS